MRIRSVASVIVGAFVTLVLTGPVVAQTTAPAPPAGVTAQTTQSPSTPKVDLFAGLGLWHEEGSTWSGFHLAGAYRPWRHVGFVGDVAFYGDQNGYKPPTTIMGGVRVYIPIQRVTLFAQVLAGRAPLDDFAIQPGFGLDVHLTRHLAIRVAGDVKVSGDDGSTYFGSRFSTGAVFALGGK